MDSERAIVADLRRGDPAAFDRAYDATRARVYAFLARLSGRRDVAEDLLQEVFLRLATRGHALADDTRLLPWLFTVARHLWIDHCRRTLLDAERLDALSAAPDSTPPGPFESIATTEAQRRLEHALGALPPAHREVILLVAVERLEPAEAAAVLSIRPEALRQRLSRARAELAECLAEPMLPMLPTRAKRSTR